jgi:RHS repeat-associated protein
VVLQSKTGMNATKYVYALGTRPLAQNDTAWEYLLPDALGSVRQIVDGSGNVTLAESYEPYGSVLTSTGTASSIFAYAGEQIDTSGLVFLRARYMQPMLGIFLARDPWSGDQLRPGSMNGYSYVEGNPINRVDPAGKSSTYPPEPPPYIPTFNRDYLLPFNGYIEGVSSVSSLGAHYAEIHGREIVYSFVTHESATFAYKSRPIPVGCGLNAGNLFESTTNAYVGTYDFWGSDKAELKYNRTYIPIDIIQEYNGPFINFTGNASYSKQIPLAQALNIPVAGGVGLGVFCSTLGTPFPVLDIPGWNLFSTQCGSNISISGGFGIGLPVTVGVYFTQYTGFDKRHYSELEQMITDISNGRNTPIGLAQIAFRLPIDVARSMAVNAAREIWLWQANYGR